MISIRAVALALVGALALGAFGPAAAAQATPIPLVGTLVTTPRSGSAADHQFLSAMVVTQGAPAGYTGSSATYVFQNGQNRGAISAVRTAAMPTSAGTSGLDGTPASLSRTDSPDNDYLSDRSLSELDIPLVTGRFEVRYYYSPSTVAPDPASDPYVALAADFDSATGVWIVARPVSAVVTTSTSLTASAVDSTITLQATIRSGSPGPVAVDAFGSVVFRENGFPVGFARVVGGTATIVLSGVARGSHTYTALHQSQTSIYSGSTSDPATAVVAGALAAATITTTVPQGLGALTLTAVTPTVALGTAVLTGGTLVSSGTLTARVTDTRQLDYPTWTLSGQVGDFRSSSGGVIPAQRLGWTPAVSGTAPGSVAGPVVAPVSIGAGGLAEVSVLATGKPDPAGSTTDASAVLRLSAPANTSAGDYAATLTLTLI